MRRKTIQFDRNQYSRFRNTQRHPTGFWMDKKALETLWESYKRPTPSFSCSSAIVDIFLQELLQSLHCKFMEIDQARFIKHIQCRAVSFEQEIQKALNPFDYSSTDIQSNSKVQDQPHTAPNDWLCGGKVSYLEKRSNNNLHSEHHNSTKQIINKRLLPKAVSLPRTSRSLIKLTGQGSLYEKKSFEALSIQKTEEENEHQELLKQKLSKEALQTVATKIFKLTNQDFYEQNSRQFKKISNFSREFSLDYDGTVIRLSRHNISKVQKDSVLSALFKINHQDTQLTKKSKPNPKLVTQHTKTEVDTSKENCKLHEDIERLMRARKESVVNAINDLRGLGHYENQQTELQSKLSVLLSSSQGVKIRKLKS